MNKRAVNISSLVLLLALLSFILEVCIYYFIPQHYITVIVAAVISLALCQFFLETSMEYNSCLLHTATMTIASLAFCIVVYLMQPNQWIQYDYWMLVLIFVNWAVPFIFCFIRDFVDRGPRFAGYLIFFHGMSAVFAVVYVVAIAKQYFITPLLPPYDRLDFGAHNFIPFMATGTYIENAISVGTDLTPIIVYIVEIILMFIPFGFYARIYCRHLPVVLRAILYLAVPALIEMLQYILQIGRGDIDDFSLAFIGTLLGIALYHIVYSVSYEYHKRDFLEDRTVTKKLLFHFDGHI